MKVFDSTANFIASKLDIPNTVKNWFPEYINDGMVKCPFHDDDNASLHISTEGKALCHGCGWKAMNIIDLYAKMQEITYMEARKQLYDEVVDAIPASKYMTFFKLLNRNIKAQGYLHRRGLSEDTIRAFHLGYDPNTKRITIPILDQFGSCVNIRMPAFDASRKSKYKTLNTKGHGEVRLYPEWLAVKEDKLLLVEGEWDCLIGRQLGLPAVTWTGGANSWNKDYDWLFKGKNVGILYDADEAGTEGSNAAFKSLSLVAGNVYNFPPAAAGANIQFSGKDLNDWWLNCPVAVEQFREAFEQWNPPIKQAGRVCPCCGKEL